MFFLPLIPSLIGGAVGLGQTIAGAIKTRKENRRPVPTLESALAKAPKFEGGNEMDRAVSLAEQDANLTMMPGMDRFEAQADALLSNTQQQAERVSNSSANILNTLGVANQGRLGQLANMTAQNAQFRLGNRKALQQALGRLAQFKLGVHNTNMNAARTQLASDMQIAQGRSLSAQNTLSSGIQNLFGAASGVSDMFLADAFTGGELGLTGNKKSQASYGSPVYD